MITRVLPFEEYWRLAQTDFADVPASSNTCVLVVEEGERIIGCWVFAMCLHAEDLWVAEDHRRKGAVLRRLLKGAGAVANESGVRAVCVGVADPGIAALVTKFGGVTLEGDSYVMPLGRFQI